MNLKPVQIARGTTRAVITVNPNDDYASLIRSITHGKLTDYEMVQTRYGRRRIVPTRKFIKVDVIQDKLYIPVNALPLIVDQLTDVGAPIEITDDPIIEPRPMSVRMIKSFEPRPEQVGVIDFLTNQNMSRKGLATATGSGKTVSSIASMVKLGHVGMIIVSGLQDQWVRSIFQFTNATKDQVYLIQGIESIQRLLELHTKPDIFVCSLETVRLWVNRKNNYQDLPSWESFLKYFGVGTKIMDEVHLNFHADTIIDLSSNIKENIYLTATFTAASATTRRIFELIYPRDMRYGEHLRKKYIDVYTYAYRGDVAEKKCVKSRGYNHAKYEIQLLKHPVFLRGFFKDVIYPLVNSHYVNKRKEGQKMLIYFSTLEMVDAAYNWFKETYPDFKIVKYIMGVPDTVLMDNEIIISTPKKAGCGTDIKNLKTVIQTVSIKAATLVDQSRGRLRELPNGDTPEYVEIVDWCIKSQVRHYYERKQLHEIRARRCYFFNLP